MKSYRGFTLIELLVTITIMVVLMTLAVFGVRTIQVSARDNERKTDVDAIARGLEQRYKLGNPKITGDTKGRYPGANEILHAQGQNFCGDPIYNPCHVPGWYMTELLPGTTDETFKAPGVTGNAFLVPWLDHARRDPAHPSNVTALQNGLYLYIPLARDPSYLCHSVDDCVRFELYYRTEADGVTHVVKSKNR